VGELNSKREANYLIVDKETTSATIEETFQGFLQRPDISMVLITQSVAEDIRHLLDAHVAAIPAILEIPSKDNPYDMSKDSILRRARGMFSAEDFR
jgi:V-type H+-transporting ATPase subunit F